MQLQLRSVTAAFRGIATRDKAASSMVFGFPRLVLALLEGPLVDWMLLEPGHRAGG